MQNIAIYVYASLYDLFAQIWNFVKVQIRADHGLKISSQKYEVTKLGQEKNARVEWL